jgi:hypothetical protein
MGADPLALLEQAHGLATEHGMADQQVETRLRMLEFQAELGLATPELLDSVARLATLVETHGFSGLLSRLHRLQGVILSSRANGERGEVWGRFELALKHAEQSHDLFDELAALRTMTAQTDAPPDKLGVWRGKISAIEGLIGIRSP